jgi:hypothetical protein
MQLKTKKENKDFCKEYRSRLKARGLIITTYLMPRSLVKEVKQYIQQRTKELELKG